METDMENDALEDHSDSSEIPRLGLNSESSAPNTKPNSSDAPAEVATNRVAPTPTLLDVLLSQLQSQLGEISDVSSEGVAVRIFQRDDGLAILLGGVKLCPIHHLIHSGSACPICQ
jgi:hypothetical protein